MSRRTLGLGPLNLAGMLGRLGLGGASLPSQPLLQFLHNGFTAPDTLTTGALYVADNLGILRTAGVDKLAIPGARLDGSAFVLTDAGGAPLFSSTTRKTKSQGSVLDYSIDPDWQGMVVAPARTNLALHSKSLDNALYWVTLNIPTITANTVAGPDGELTAEKITVNTTNGQHVIYKQSLISVGNPITISADVKQGEHTWCSVSDTVAFGVYVNLATGAVGTITGTPTSYSVTPSGNGYWHISLSGTAASGSGVGVYIAQSDGVNSFAGANTTDGIYVTNMKCVQAIGDVHSPISTTTAPVPRAATVASFNSADRLLANDTGGSVRVVPHGGGQTGWLFNSYTDATAEFGLLVNPTTIVLRNRNASVDTDLTLSYTHVADRPFEVAWTHTAADGLAMRVREYTSSAWQAWSAWTTLDSAGAKANATIAATYQYGRNGANQFAGTRPVLSTV